MEIIFGIIVIFILFIFLSGKSGVGIKSSLIKEIYRQYHGGISAGSKYYPSISLEEAYNVLKIYDLKDQSHIQSNEYSFWVLVQGEPCLLSLKKEPFKKGFRLLVTKGSDYNMIINSYGLKSELIPSNLKSL